MEYIKATEAYTQQIFELVQNTIQTVYPRYYPKEVVTFFCELHSKENILKDMKSGSVSILLKDDQLVGTGSYRDNHITRVYVAPEHQGNGYGSYMMQNLEKEISLNYDNVYLDASLPASCLYEHRGYRTVKHETWEVENNVVLVYEIMKKELCNAVTALCYEGK